MAVTGLYLGNSALGQLADSSGNSRTLTVGEARGNPTTPTPPEGDRWLAEESGASTLGLLAPTSVINATNGKIEFSVRYPSGGTLVIGEKSLLRVENGATTVFELKVDWPGGGPLRFIVIRNGVSVTTQSVTRNFTHRWRFEWDPIAISGISFYLDEVFLGGSATPLFGTITAVRIQRGGSPPLWPSSFVDAVMFADVYNEPYLPLPVPTASTLNMRRRR